MDDYLILLPGDETSWEQASPEQQAAVYDQHHRFARMLAERGHTMVGGAHMEVRPVAANGSAAAEAVS